MAKQADPDLDIKLMLGLIRPQQAHALLDEWFRGVMRDIFRRGEIYDKAIGDCENGLPPHHRKYLRNMWETLKQYLDAKTVAKRQFFEKALWEAVNELNKYKVQGWQEVLFDLNNGGFTEAQFIKLVKIANSEPMTS